MKKDIISRLHSILAYVLVKVWDEKSEWTESIRVGNRIVEGKIDKKKDKVVYSNIILYMTSDNDRMKRAKRREQKRSPINGYGYGPTRQADWKSRQRPGSSHDGL